MAAASDGQVSRRRHRKTKAIHLPDPSGIRESGRKIILLHLTWFVRDLVMAIQRVPVNMTELGQFCADAASSGPEPAQCWHITACLPGTAVLHQWTT